MGSQDSFHGWGVTRSPEDSNSEDINSGFDNLKTQIEKLQESAAPDDTLKTEIQSVVTALQRVETQREELNARFLLPSNRTVPLVRLDLVTQFQQHRSDGSIAFLLIGAFGGAILGIVINWATNENFTITRPSIVLMGILAVLLLGSIIWAVILQLRSANVWKQVVQESIAPRPLEQEESSHKP